MRQVSYVSNAFFFNLPGYQWEDFNLTKEIALALAPLSIKTAVANKTLAYDVSGRLYHK